ncbi:MAG TPA: ribonuclease E/G [Lachnoclostridium phytofermentans]|uniref:Ribonuclease E/G n=1 Tax=Lachnoclostridium phytofermentans TaxID=66219 RepID=A0A3D2X372_9FIRM|nr:ribonuclease E/G [Lachnoclostridium sp.]HCL00985.1 ribonuclease E/G [Lachnoclostridium phytofermentans]
MSGKLIVTKMDDNIVTALYEGNQMIQVNVDREEEVSSLGNIYIGKVKNIVKNINAAFVEISDKKMCYLPLADVVNPIFTNGKSSDKVNIGDELVVQVIKEDIKTKAPVVTTSISFTGKYVVLMHGTKTIGISTKIGSEQKRKSLRSLVSPLLGEQYGFVLRTNAMEAEDGLIVEEIEQLKNQYDRILTYGIYRNRFSLLYKTLQPFLCAIRDGFAKDLEAIITDDLSLYDEIKEYLTEHQKEDIEKLTFYQDKLLALSKLYSIETKLSRALREKVWLPCGGSLIIQPTEALTVIDVNTGKAVSKKKNVQETFLKVNLEAAEEIAAQIRLRNLSGIIIVDFIDMISEDAKTQLLRVFEEYLIKDPIKTTLVDMTALNLVEITRKKVRKPLHEQMKHTELAVCEEE